MPRPAGRCTTIPRTGAGTTSSAPESPTRKVSALLAPSLSGRNSAPMLVSARAGATAIAPPHARSAAMALVVRKRLTACRPLRRWAPGGRSSSACPAGSPLGTRDRALGKHRRSVLEAEARGDRPASARAALGSDDALDVQQLSLAVDLLVVRDVFRAQGQEGAERR